MIARALIPFDGPTASFSTLTAAGGNLILLASVLLIGALTTSGARALDHEIIALRALVARLDVPP